MRDWGIVATREPLTAMPVAKFHHARERLFEDRGIHLRSPEDAVGEGNRYLHKSEAEAVRRVLHFYLECIALEVYIL